MMLESLMNLFSGGNQGTGSIPIASRPVAAPQPTFDSTLGNLGKNPDGNSYADLFKMMTQNNRNNGIKKFDAMSTDERWQLLGDLGKKLSANSRGKSLMSALGDAAGDYRAEKEKAAMDQDALNRGALRDVYGMYDKDRGYGLDKEKIAVDRDYKNRNLDIEEMYKKGMLGNANASLAVQREGLGKSQLGNDINAIASALKITPDEAYQRYVQMDKSNAADPRDKLRAELYKANVESPLSKPLEELDAMVDRAYPMNNKAAMPVEQPGVQGPITAPPGMGKRQTPPKAAIDELIRNRDNSAYIKDFVSKYGDGSASKILGFR